MFIITSAADNPVNADLALGTDVATVDGNLVVVARSYGRIDEADLADAKPVEITMTADGGQVVDGWHDGQGVVDPDAWVRYERWNEVGRVSHGYVHAESRRILQVG